MKEIAYRWSKKYLSQIINLLSGVILIILIINRYTGVKISMSFLDFISVNNYNENRIMWIFVVLLYSKIIFVFVNQIIKFICEDNEEKYYSRLVISYTFNDILDLIASIYGMFFLIIAFKGYIVNGVDYSTSLARVSYMGIGLRFLDSVFCHFYYTNLSIVDKALKNRRE